MDILGSVATAEALAKALQKPVLYLNLPDLEDNQTYGDLFKAAPFLNVDPVEKIIQALLDGVLVIVCENREEQQRLYNSVVGDDGPTELNAYDGPLRIYALTINAQGEIENENT